MTVRSGQSNGTVELTPSGIPIFFQSQPKRCYRIGTIEAGALDTPEMLLASAQNDNFCWREIPSVTTILDVLDASGPLIWWAQGLGGIGTLRLQDKGVSFSSVKELLARDTKEADDLARQELCSLLTEHSLSTNQVKEQAGDRGQAVHDALENWARNGHMPDPSIYPEEQAGYVRGLVDFLKSVPSAEPVACEVMVASAEHGYAGRYDLRVRTSQPHDVVYHHTPVRGPKLRRMEPGEYLVDLKTSKDIFPKHSRQLEAYEQASIESGYEPTDGRGILQVSADGKHKFRRSWAVFEDFRVVLDVWNSEREMAARKKTA